jgi:hypothetical protein
LPEEDSLREPSPNCERQNTTSALTAKYVLESAAKQLPEAREQQPRFRQFIR